MNPELVDRISDILDQRVVGSRPVVGGYTAAERWICDFENGGSAFAKIGVDARTAGWLREEHHVYRHIDAAYMPKLLGWSDEGSKPIMLLEDLSHADWPPAWTLQRIDRVLDLIEAVAQTTPPPGLPRLVDQKDEVFSGWASVARDPLPFLSLGLCSVAWLERSIEQLLLAEANALGWALSRSTRASSPRPWWDSCWPRRCGGRILPAMLNAPRPTSWQRRCTIVSEWRFSGTSTRSSQCCWGLSAWRQSTRWHVRCSFLMRHAVRVAQR